MQSTVNDPVKSARQTPHGQQGEMFKSSGLTPYDKKNHSAKIILSSSTKESLDEPSITRPLNDGKIPSNTADEPKSVLEIGSASDIDIATSKRGHGNSPLFSNEQKADQSPRLRRKRTFEDECDEKASIEAKANKRVKPSPLGEGLRIDLSNPLNFDFDAEIREPYYSLDDWFKYWETDINKPEGIVDLPGQVLCQGNDNTPASNSVHLLSFDQDGRETPIGTVAARLSADDLYTHACGRLREYKAHVDGGSDSEKTKSARDEMFEAWKNWNEKSTEYVGMGEIRNYGEVLDAKGRETLANALRVESNQLQSWIEEALPMRERAPLPIPNPNLGVDPAAVSPSIPTHVPRAFRAPPPPTQTQRQRTTRAPAQPTSRRRAAPAAASAPASLPAHATIVAPTPTPAPVPTTTSVPLVNATPVPAAVAIPAPVPGLTHAPAQVLVPVSALVSAPVVAASQLPLFTTSPHGRVAGKNEDAKTAGKLPSWAKEVLYTNSASDLTQWISGREAALRQPNAVGMTIAEEQWVLSELYGPAREDLTPQQKRVSAEKRAYEALPDSQKPILLDGVDEVKNFTRKERDFALVCRASFTLADRVFSYQTSVCGQSFSSNDIVLRHIKEQHMDGGRKKKKVVSATAASTSTLASTSTNGSAAATVAVPTNQTTSSSTITTTTAAPLSTSATSTVPSTSASAATSDPLPAQDELSQ
ncbi:hypothetical protein FRC17_009471 [Serendipita sp. 399]|nr:hypothetical protein FRC17_009471 [Serendipita sp. 399]